MNKLNKSGFTLIELIFVILIIGILSAVAVPKFANLKQNAEVSSVIKVATDAYTSIPASYVNIVDLEEDKNNSNSGTNPVVLTDLIDITGKDWNTSVENVATFKQDGTDIVTLTLGTDRNASLNIDCTQFSDSTSIAKCKDKIGDNSLDLNTSF